MKKHLGLIFIILSFVLSILIWSFVLPILLSPTGPLDTTRDELRIEPSKLDLLQDDRLEDKNPVFDPALVDSRLLKSFESRWEINASDAITRLDILDPGSAETRLVELFPSYAAAAQHLRNEGYPILPSINSLDGKAKQFDDGLMAAVISVTAPQQARRDDRIPGLLTRLLGKFSNASEAYAWVFAALETGGYLSPDQLAKRPDKAAELHATFASSHDAKPIAFYTWSSDLERLWRLYKFLQQPISGKAQGALRGAILADDTLARDYRRLLGFIARLSNPPTGGTLLEPEGDRFLPPMSTKEDALFLKLFGEKGVPEGVELMQEFVKAIRSGKVDLKLGDKSGWYDYQIHALETFLLPDRGRESQKLLLTKKYKQRMLEAFKALVTKRRETQFLMAAPAAAPAADLPQPDQAPEVSPRLRVEPNPTYYLRMARSYAFIEHALQTFLREDERQQLVGLREGGQRDQPLLKELAGIKEHFYGLHLIAAEDIGMKPELLDGELADPAAAKTSAEKYLGQWERDPDLAADTRVCVPIWIQGERYRLWCTLGVKGIKFVASYSRPPRGRLAGSKGDWTLLKAKADSTYLILADEFGEITAATPLNRAELRAVADREKTKDRIVQALSK